MQARISYTAGGRGRAVTLDLPAAEQGFWRGVSELLPSVDVPSAIVVSAGGGRAVLDVTQRGTFMSGGVEKPSMFVVPVENTIALAAGEYADAYLTCINPDTRGGRGNYKFYRLSQRADGAVTAFYGRIGQAGGFGAQREIKEPMPSWMFEVRRAEKLSKGYVDRSETFCVDADNATAGRKPGGAREDGLYSRLLAFARGRVSSSLASGAGVTAAQVEECGKLLGRMGRCRKVDSFNARLLELMALSPRRAQSVAEFLAASPADFARIIDREESLLAAMRAVADAASGGGRAGGGFSAAGVSWRELPGGERAQAEALVPGGLRGRVRSVYLVEAEGQRARFDAYLARRGLDAADVRLMWHGSRNENWCSIVSRSLMLNPNAQITGKMFGHGIYFGYDERDGGAYKSWNYTSARGSRWAGGDCDTAFMGLYECAYGNPHHPDRAGSFDKGWLDGRGYDCVHARGGDCGLAHDEVVFYDEAAVCIKYLYEFSA